MELNLEFLRERYALSIEKIHQIVEEPYGDSIFQEYFAEVAAFICQVDAYRNKAGQGCADIDGREGLFWDILPANYVHSYANPAYAAEKLGEDYGKILCALYAEIRRMILFAWDDTENSQEEIVIRMELFIEVYSAFVYEWQENQLRPSAEGLRQILYWYFSDYADLMFEDEIIGLITRQEPAEPGKQAVMNACGYGGCCRNKQYEYDHREDAALVWDKGMAQRKLEVMRIVLEKYKAELCRIEWKTVEEADETSDFVPEQKKEALHFSEGQKKMWKEYCLHAKNLKERFFCEQINDF